MLAPVCGSDGIWESWGPSCPGSEESAVSSRLAGTLQATLHLSQAAHDMGAVLSRMCPCASVPVKRLGKQDQLPFAKHFMQGSISSLIDERGWLEGRLRERLPCVPAG